MPPRTPEGGSPPILATSSRNGSKKLDRLRCEGLPLAPKNRKKSHVLYMTSSILCL